MTNDFNGKPYVAKERPANTRAMADGVLRMKTLRRLRPSAVVVLVALAASCEDTNFGGLPPRPCNGLIGVEPTGGFITPITLSVGSSQKFRVRLGDEREGLNLDLYRHCPSMSLDKFEWTVNDPSVVRVEGRGEEVTVTGLAAGRTEITVRYSDYVGRNGRHIETLRLLEVVESQSMEPSAR